MTMKPKDIHYIPFTLRQPESTFHGVADLAEQYNEYIHLYEQDPFAAATITVGDELAQALTVEQRKTWQTLIKDTDMTHNSNKAWSLIKKLSNDPRKADQHINVTPNQFAHQLILNDFTIIELQNSLKHLKNGKSSWTRRNPD